MTKRKVTYAKLHDSFFIPGASVGNMKDTLPPDNKTLPNFDMQYIEETGALLLSWDGVGVGGKPVKKQYIIGAATVKCAQLEDLQPTPVATPVVVKSASLEVKS